ncbi:hypothetical protein [Rasiella sp. SM2506]|uniref:hypothetical protein n=1 Tax=Rasiella sp. SM2506 TaxID=3423914 RepID=UPI003D7B7CFE
MKYNFTFLLLFIFLGSYAQEIVVTKDSLQLEFKKNRKASKFFNVRQSNEVNSDKLTKRMFRVKIESLNEKPVDINAFSLVDTKNKVRYRVGDYIGYKGISIGGSGVHSSKYLKTELLNKRGKPLIPYPKYDENIEDTFTNYDFEGYHNIEFETNFKTRKKPKLSIVYYGPTTMKKFTADLYFITINELDSSAELELYYKKEKINDIEL